MNDFPTFDAKEAETLEICPVCGEKTLIMQPFNIGGKRIEQKKRLECQCARGKREAEEAREKAHQTEAELMRKWSNMPYALTDFRGDTFARDDRANASVSDTCKRYCERWDTMRRENFGIMFCGTVGTGKTFLSHSIANQLIAQGVNVCVTSVSRAVNYARFSEDRQKAIDLLCSFDLLVVDDLGTERDTEIAREFMFSLIDQRARTKKPLVVTTNLNPQALNAVSDTGLKRIYDRVMELCPIQFNLSGDSRRASNAAERRQRAREALR